MPDAATVGLLIDKYGWPGLTVAVLLFILWRVMLKHEGQMTKSNDIQQNIVMNLQALASGLSAHDRDEEQRHRATQDQVGRRGR